MERNNAAGGAICGFLSPKQKRLGVTRRRLAVMSFLAASLSDRRKSDSRRIRFLRPPPPSKMHSLFAGVLWEHVLGWHCSKHIDPWAELPASPCARPPAWILCWCSLSRAAAAADHRRACKRGLMQSTLLKRKKLQLGFYHLFWILL
jgi:hypothetical protein